MVSISEDQFGKDGGFLERLKSRTDKGERVFVLDSDLVEAIINQYGGERSYLSWRQRRTLHQQEEGMA